MNDHSNQTRRSSLLEIASAIVLSLAGLLTTFVGYQADLWAGVQQDRYAEFGALQRHASRKQIEYQQLLTIEVSIFSDWMQARANEEWSLAEFYRTRFPPNLRSAFDEWQAKRNAGLKDVPISPFHMRSYVRTDPAAQKLYDQASTAWTAGQKASAISSSFGRGNVMLASAMFFAGMAQVFRIHRLRLVLVSVAVVTCSVGVIRILTLPMLQPG